MVLLSIALFIGALFYAYRIGGIGPLIATFFLLFGFVLRMFSTGYVGLFGPVFAEHFQRFIEDDGLAGLVFTLSLLIVIGAMIVILNPRSIARSIQPVRQGGKDMLGRMAFLAFAGYMTALYVDMAWRGVIPLFSLMERNVYTEFYAGPFHKALLAFLFVFAFTLGFFFVRPRTKGNSYDIRYLGILGALYLYFLLTGHRVSAFFTTTAYFAIPVAAMIIQARVRRLPPLRDPRRTKRMIGMAKKAAPVLGVVMVGLIAYSLYNSLFNVRGYADPLEAFTQRSLIQPTELWWVTWESSIKGSGIDKSQAWIAMFKDPIDATRNTGIQYLMARELGFDRTAQLLHQGEQFAGGYPEVLFELLGPFAAWPAMIIFAIATMVCLRIAVVAACNQHLGTGIFAVFLFYAFSLLYIGGMLNFLLAPTLLAKVALLVFFILVEGKRRPRRHSNAIAPPPFGVMRHGG